MVPNTTANVTEPDEQPLSACDTAQTGGLEFESHSEHGSVFLALSLSAV